MRCSGLHERSRFGLFAHVRTDEMRFGAELSQLCDDHITLLRRATVHDDTRTFSSEAQRNALAESLSRARDQRHLSGQSGHSPAPCTILLTCSSAPRGRTHVAGGLHPTQRVCRRSPERAPFLHRSPVSPPFLQSPPRSRVQRDPCRPRVRVRDAGRQSHRSSTIGRSRTRGSGPPHSR